MTEPVKLFIDGSSGNPELEEALACVLFEYHELWKTKQRKYGTGNIATYGRPGLIIRMNDKFQRLRNFVLNGVKGDAEGSEDDAWFDLMGYAAMGLMVYRDMWPDAPKDRITFKQMINVIKQFFRGTLKWSQ